MSELVIIAVILIAVALIGWVSYLNYRTSQDASFALQDMADKMMSRNINDYVSLKEFQTGNYQDEFQDDPPVSYINGPEDIPDIRDGNE